MEPCNVDLSEFSQFMADSIETIRTTVDLDALRAVMAQDSRFELMRMLEAILYQECVTVESGLPIVDAILERYSAKDLRSLASSYGIPLKRIEREG